MKIPVIEREVVPTGTRLAQPKAPGVVPGAFGTDIAKATSNLGAVVEDVGSAMRRRENLKEEERVKGEMLLQKHLEERRQQTIESLAADREVQFRTDMQNSMLNQDNETVKVNGADVTRPRGLLLRSLDQSIGSTVEFDNNYRNNRQKYLDGIENEDTQKKLAERLDSLYIGYRDNIISHEAQQTRQSMVKKNESLLNLQISDASRIMSAEGMFSAIKDAHATQGKIDDIIGVDAITRENNKKIIAGKIASRAVISTLVNTGDKEQAQALLDSLGKEGESSSYLISEDDRANIKAMMKKIEAQQKKNQISERNLAINEEYLRVIKGQSSFDSIDAGVADGKYNMKDAQSLKKLLVAQQPKKDDKLTIAKYLDNLAGLPIDDMEEAQKVVDLIKNDKNIKDDTKALLIYSKSMAGEGGKYSLADMANGKIDLGNKKPWYAPWTWFKKINRNDAVEAFMRFQQSLDGSEDAETQKKKAQRAMAEVAIENNPNLQGVGKDWQDMVDAEGNMFRIRKNEDGGFDTEGMEDNTDTGKDEDYDTGD